MTSSRCVLITGTYQFKEASIKQASCVKKRRHVRSFTAPRFSNAENARRRA